MDIDDLKYCNNNKVWNLRKKIVIEGAVICTKQKRKDQLSFLQVQQKKNTPRKFCWWRPDAICRNYKQTGHVTKVCKFKDAQHNTHTHAQTAEAVIEEICFCIFFKHNKVMIMDRHNVCISPSKTYALICSFVLLSL